MPLKPSDIQETLLLEVCAILAEGIVEDLDLAPAISAQDPTSV